jgi:VanZ family protein
MRALRYLWIWLALGWAGAALIVVLSLVPSPPEVVSGHSLDKLAHFLAYACLMMWFGFIYLPGRSYVYLGLGFVAMGIVLEWVQGATGYRVAEYPDMMANGSGVLFGWVLSRTRLGSTLVTVEGFLRTR